MAGDEIISLPVFYNSLSGTEMPYFPFRVFVIPDLTSSIHKSLNIKNVFGHTPVSKASRMTSRRLFIADTSCAMLKTSLLVSIRILFDNRRHFNERVLMLFCSFKLVKNLLVLLDGQGFLVLL